MKNNVSGVDDCENDIDWDTGDELEISGLPSSCSGLTTPGDGAVICNGEASSSTGSSSSKLIPYFVAMGFSKVLVAKVIAENGEDTAESAILETLLTYSALETSPEVDQCTPEENQSVDFDESSSDYDESFLYDLSDSDSWSENERQENTVYLPPEEKTLRCLANMGYTIEESSIALERCGPEASIGDLMDFISAAQIAKAEAANLPLEVVPRPSNGDTQKLKKRKLCADLHEKKYKGMPDEACETIRLPKPMIGFGIPFSSGLGCDSPDHSSWRVTRRDLPEQAIGPPYFYYENVALTPKGVWDTISRFLYDVEPEFVDSKYFCAAARKRGYVHNLPIDGRFPLLPPLPLTIHEAFPLTKRWWPSWDPRTKLNCLQTAIGSAKLQERIRKLIEPYGDDEPPDPIQKAVIYECRKWNLVWVGRNKVAPLEPDEVEVLLGFPRNHTRGGGISRTDRYKSLGNSFQVNTVAYHLSVLKRLYPNGMNILSLFSGIGGAEVALHRLGIPLNNVVSVEKSEQNRNIVKCWWEQTNQRGNLIDFDDVQLLTADRLEMIINNMGGFDLVIGGSPCNNLAGSNRVSRDGLEGKESALFYDYFRILDAVKNIMVRR